MPFIIGAVVTLIIITLIFHPLRVLKVLTKAFFWVALIASIGCRMTNSCPHTLSVTLLSMLVLGAIHTYEHRNDPAGD